MNTFQQRGLLALFLALALGFVGCDSDSTAPPPVETAYCEDSPAAFGCADSGTRYDTTGTDVNDRPTIEVRDLNGGIGGALGTNAQTTVRWSSDFTYILDGLVFVNPGQTLQIDAGTVIRARSGQGRNSSALIVARDARIEADGTADEPIIMTALDDDIEDPMDLIQDGAPRSGLWGGLIVLGRAPTNIAVGETNVEGIDASEERGLYGGTDANDDSGVLRYVSIRHGGTLIGEGNEINGLTLGAVGAGTTIDYVEVFANQDDGVEWFGGTAQVKHLAISYCGDDMFDYDQGYNGVNQYVFGLMASTFGDNGGEHDGGDSSLGGEAGEAAEPFAIPTFANVTYIGSGMSAPNSSRVMNIRDNAGAKYWRSIFYDFQNGIQVEDRDGSEGDSRARAESDDIKFVDVVFSNVVGGTPSATDIFNYADGDGEVTEQAPVALFDGPITYNNPGLTVNRGQGNALSLAATSAPAPTVALPGGFLDNTDFIGAFGSGTNWLGGWTALSQFQTIN